MCGRFTVKMSWAEIVALYKLTLDRPPHNLPPNYNVCPTDPIDVVTQQDGKRDFVRMRWGLVPRWWSKPLKELRAATFNARVETVETKPFFRDAFKRTRCLIEHFDAGFAGQPRFEILFGQQHRHTIMDLGNEAIGLCDEHRAGSQGFPACAVAPFVPQAGGRQGERAIARRKIPGLLAARRVLPFVIARHRGCRPF